MKYLLLVIRVFVLCSIAILGFLAVFPNSYQSLEYLYDEFKKEPMASQFKEEPTTVVTKDQSIKTNPCDSERTSQPVGKVQSSIETTNHTPTKGSIPKILINRDPEVFDTVCRGDTLHYKLYAENVDRIMVSYDNEAAENFSYIIIEPVRFENAIQFTVPEEWLGASSISATGYVKGKMHIATNRVTYTILDPESH